MSIVTVIETVVATLDPEAQFIHGRKGWQNLKADEATYPVAYLDEPITSNDTYHQGGLVDNAYPLRMMFLDQSQKDFTPAQHREIIDRMRTMSRQFILTLKQQKNSNLEHIFKSIDTVQTTDVYEVFDVILSGVIVTFTATPLNSDSVCV